jgi:RNA polymerase sigma factor (sigma-70 family)
MQDSAAALLRACAESSDPDLWSRFVRLFRPRLAAAVTRALWRSGQRADRELVAELIQEAYCRMLVADRHVLRAFRGTTNGEAHTYLMRVAESATLDRLRSEAAAKRGAGLLIVESEAEAERHDAPDPAASPEMLLVRRDLWRLFWERCQALVGSRDRERDLAILEQAVFQGWTSREIARQRGLSASTIDTIVHRIRRRLARRGIYLPTRSGTVQEVAERDLPDDSWRQ